MVHILYQFSHKNLFIFSDNSVDILLFLLYIIINNKICYITGGTVMDSYREGYERYCSACEEFGLESRDFYFFISHLTEEQLNAYKEYSKRSKDQND